MGFWYNIEKEKKLHFSVVEIRPALSLNQNINFRCGGGE